MSGGSTPSQTQQTQAQTQTQQTNSSTAPPSGIQPYLQQGIQALVGDFNANPTAPGYYPGATVAPQSQATQSAIQALFQRGAGGSPVDSAANSAVMAALDPSRLDLSNNPYFGKAVSAYVDPLNQQFANQVLPAIAGQFEGAGRFGPNNGTVSATNQALAQLTQAEANATAGMANTAYQQAQQNQLSAAGLAPTLANQDFANIAAMFQAGQAIDANTQANIDSNVARYNYETTAQPNYISNYLQRLLASYPGGESSGNSSGSSNASSYGTSTPATNPTANMLSALFGSKGLFG
jgi:hypothetical protein